MNNALKEYDEIKHLFSLYLLLLKNFATIDEEGISDLLKKV